MTARLYLGGRYVGDVARFSFSHDACRPQPPPLPARTYTVSFQIGPEMVAMLVEASRVDAACRWFRRKAHARLSHDSREGGC